MQQSPLISVILPVYNGAEYLREAIQSILGQSYENLELIIINDGSTDNSDQVIAGFSDKRIHYTEQQNHGLAATLNIGIKQSKGAFIARQDQDDISAPDRLKKQLDFLQKHPKVGMVGSWAKIIVETKPTERVLEHPTSNEDLQFMVLFDTPFVHSSVMIRRAVFDAVGGYTTDPKRQPPEDYELWSRIARKYQLANLPEYLLTYRETGGSMSRTGNDPFTDKVIMISQENIAAASGRPLDDPAVRGLAELVHRSAKPAAPRGEIIRLLESLAVSGVSGSLVGRHMMQLQHHSPTTVSRLKGAIKQVVRRSK